MAELHILLIRKDDITEPIETLFDLIPENFSTLDYMKGFLAGLCFGKERLLTLEQFEIVHNDSVTSGKYFIKFLKVEGVEC